MAHTHPAHRPTSARRKGGKIMGGKVEVPMEFKIQLLYDDGKTWMDSRNHSREGTFKSTKELCDFCRKENIKAKYRIVGREVRPSRNCDVGTVKEQAERFHAFCASNKKCGDVYSCERCQFNSVEDCELAWAQMLYEEGGTNGK